MGYVTADAFKSYMAEMDGSVPSSYTANETAVVQDFIDQATAEIERVTGRVFVAVTATHAFTEDHITDGVLYLGEDLAEVTTVRNGDGSTITNYWAYPLNTTPKDRIVLKSTETWTFNTDTNVEIVGKWGYSVACPADVKRICMRLAWFYWTKRGASGETQILGDQTIQVAANYPADIVQALKAYKRGAVL